MKCLICGLLSLVLVFSAPALPCAYAEYDDEEITIDEDFFTPVEQETAQDETQDATQDTAQATTQDETQDNTQVETLDAVQIAAHNAVTPLEQVLDEKGNLPDYHFTKISGSGDLSGFVILQPQAGEKVTSQQLKSARKILIRGDEPVDISFLAACKKTEVLYILCGVNGGFDVVGGFSSLNEFIYQGDLPVDISCLAACSKLKKLTLTGATVTGLEFLATLRGVTYMHLIAQEPAAVSALLNSQSKTLKELYLKQCEGVDVSALSEAKLLKEFALQDVSLAGGMALPMPPKLETFLLENYDMACMASWAEYKSLNRLELVAVGEADTEAIARFGMNIDSLRISDSKLTKPEALNSMKKLTRLILSGCGLTDISFLSGMTKLKDLSLANNQIADVTPLEKLTGLTACYLSGNAITDAAPLQRLTKLKTLSLSNNKITDLSPLGKLTGLRICYLSKNSITDVTPLQRLTKLEELYLTDNPELTTVTSLTKCKALRILELPANITDFEALRKLKNAKRISRQLTEQEVAEKQRAEEMQATVEQQTADAEAARADVITQAIKDGKMKPADELVDADGNLILADSKLRQEINDELDNDDDAPIPVSKLAELERLRISTSYAVFDFSFLQLCTSIRDLMCDARIKSIAPVLSLENLRRLELDYKGCDESPALLACLPNIDILELQNLSCEDTEWLAMCPNLYNLRLVNCPNIKSLDALCVSKGMTTLELVNVPVEHFPTGDGLSRRLRSVTLDGTNIKDISYLSNCPALKDVTITYEVDSILPLCGLEKLESLSLTAAKTEELEQVLATSGAGLKALTLKNMALDDEWVERLRKKHPKWDIKILN